MEECYRKKKKKKHVLRYSILLDMLFTCYGSNMVLISCFAMPVIIRDYFELNPPLWVRVARVWVRVRWWVQKRVSVPVPGVPLPVSNTTCVLAVPSESQAGMDSM